MCGITGGFGEPNDAAILALEHRGPDAQGVARRGGIWFGHTRLSIIDTSSASDQPFQRGNLTLVYNGELWNYVELRRELLDLGATFKTTGDTEVFAAAIEQWGPRALQRMQGMFGAAWTFGDDTLWLARDRHGEVPLYAFVGKPFAFASELKALRAMGLDSRGYEWVGPGEIWEVSPRGIRRQHWYLVPQLAVFEGTREQAESLVRTGVSIGTMERTISDVPVCTLLSGGIDSAAVAAHLVHYVDNLVAYVAVMDPNSPDVRAAHEVAEALDIELREVKITPPTSDDLASVIEQIEQPHKTQVEIGWACSLLARQIRADGFKVTFSGEGSDELWASYGFAWHMIQSKGWYVFRREKFYAQHRMNFARCNKVFMAQGIECRLPFLSTGLVETALSLPQNIVRLRTRRKAVLQDSYAGLLPKRIIKRQKLGFQDGLGLKPACSEAVADPRGFYRAVYAQLFGS